MTELLKKKQGHRAEWISEELAGGGGTRAWAAESIEGGDIWQLCEYIGGSGDSRKVRNYVFSALYG